MIVLRRLGLWGACAECLGENIRALRDAGPSLGEATKGHRPFSGLSRLARYTAKVLALVVLYRRVGALPALRARYVRHVGVEQQSVSQPCRSWTINLLGKSQVSIISQDVTVQRPVAGEALPFDEQLEVMSSTCSVDSVDLSWIDNVVYQLLELIRRIIG